MNAVTELNSNAHPLLPNPPMGLSVEMIMSLSEQARHLYDSIFDYCTYAADPQYQTLHKFRNQIARLANTGDREILIGYFNQDPAIQWKGIPQEPYVYYAKDFYNS